MYVDEFFLQVGCIISDFVKHLGCNTQECDAKLESQAIIGHINRSQFRDAKRGNEAMVEKSSE